MRKKERDVIKKALVVGVGVVVAMAIASMLKRRARGGGALGSSLGQLVALSQSNEGILSEDDRGFEEQLRNDAEQALERINEKYKNKRHDESEKALDLHLDNWECHEPNIN